MKPAMKVSVVIPTYNSGPLVVEAVQSVLAQTRPAYEIIVVDDGSTDDTAERLAAFGGQIQYIRQANARVAAARNTGVAAATGDAIAFLDADDAWHPEKLVRQVQVLEEQPEIGLVATQLSDWPGEFAPLAETERVSPISLEELLLKNVLATSSIVVRWSVLDRAGPFDPELFGPEDYDLWLRCAQQSGVAMLEQRLTGYRDTAGSLGKQAETMRRGLLRIHEKLAAAGVWTQRRGLQRKSRAHIDYATGYMFYVAGQSRRAAGLLMQSIWAYPWPLQPPDVRYHFARTRLLVRSAMAGAAGR
jgi:glycosyltransferase involved in cell wall biosynthesis